MSPPFLEGHLAHRLRDVNTMDDVRLFLARWDARAPSEDGFTLFTSDYGNISSSPYPGSYSAPDLTPSDEQWDVAIEAGIRGVVDAVIGGWGAITYTSCGGHQYPGIGLPAVPAEVGLLPRDTGEDQQLAIGLSTVCAGEHVGLGGVVCRVYRNSLQCESSDERFVTLDLVFEPAVGVGWVDYFLQLPHEVDRVAAVIRSTRVGVGSSTCVEDDLMEGRS